MNIFLDNANIGTDKAPDEIFESVNYELSYNAVLKKRFGIITPEDFLRFARRFAAICNKAYGEDIELKLSFNDSSNIYSSTDESRNMERLTEKEFFVLFTDARSVVLTIHPGIDTPEASFSVARIEWSSLSSKMIYLSGQQGDTRSSSQKALENMLFSKMFFVRDSAPTWNFQVNLGVEALVREAYPGMLKL